MPKEEILDQPIHLNPLHQMFLLYHTQKYFRQLQLEVFVDSLDQSG